MKNLRKIIPAAALTLTLLGAALCSGCAYRPDWVEMPSDVPEVSEPTIPETTIEDGRTYFTVTYTLDGEVLASERVAEGETPSGVPAERDRQNIVSWTNVNGVEVDVWSASVLMDTEYRAVTGPALLYTGGFIAAEDDGLFHPLGDFTRSDAARAVYALFAEKPKTETFLKDVTTRAKCYTAAAALAELGYMKLDENSRFYPDTAITLDDLAALLGHIFSPGAVKTVLEDCTEPLSRAKAAEVLSRLLGLTAQDVSETPYFPDVSPKRDWYEAVSLAGGAGSAWSGETKEGFVNLDGYLYAFDTDGYFVSDAMVGTLYFDTDCRYTSGDAQLDTFVAEIVDAQTNRSMSREEMLRAVYDYVRDHYLYLKRSIYEVGHTGWEIEEALVMFETGKGNCYNFTGAFWALARGVGYDAVAYCGLVGVGRDPHSWLEIEFDGEPYVFDVETEMSNRLNGDYYTSMFKMTYETAKLWSYAKEPYADEAEG